MVPLPKTRFNFAWHLSDCNASRPTKTAYIDDLENVSMSPWQ